MSKVIHKENERGQIIILLAVSVVVVMVVAALAVDGGMIYSERRFAQNAADSAAFAGGGAVYNSGKLDEVLVCPASSSDSLITTIVSQAQARAAANNISSLPFLGYEKNNEDFIPDENQGIWVVCNDNTDPKTIDVIVRVTSQVSTAFAHLIYPGPLQTTNESIVTISQEGSVLSGDALVSLSKNCNNNGNQNNNEGGVIFNNALLVLKIQGSGVYSNSCINLHKNPAIIEVDGGFNYVKNIIDENKWTEDLLEQFNKVNNYWNDDYLKMKSPKEECDALKAADESEHKYDDTNTLEPGYYPDGMHLSGKNNLEEGLYCIENQFKVNNGELTGTDVTIYLYETAVFDLNGGTVKLVAETDPAEKYFGILFYIDGVELDNDPKIKTIWNGSNNMYMNGIFYAPFRNVRFSGNSDNVNGSCPGIDGFDCKKVTFPTQIIGNQIVLKGSSTININNSGKSISTLQNNLFLKD